MATYSVYLPPDITDVDRMSDTDRSRAAFLHDGKAIFALIAPAIWLLWHRLWLPFGLYCLAVATVLAIGVQLSAEASTLLSILPGLYLLIEGQELVRLRHEKEGWHFDGVVDAANKEQAELRYFSKVSFDRDSTNREITQKETKRSVLVNQRGPDMTSGLFPE